MATEFKNYGCCWLRYAATGNERFLSGGAIALRRKWNPEDQFREQPVVAHTLYITPDKTISTVHLGLCAQHRAAGLVGAERHPIVLPSDRVEVYDQDSDGVFQHNAVQSNATTKNGHALWFGKK